MNLAGLILKMFGWKVEITVPDYEKALICVAPQTSNWDFIIGKLAYASVGRKAGFLMKEDWFFWPLGPVFRSIGGIPVPRRRKSGSLTETIIEKFRTTNSLVLAITPEGTRSRNTDWHTGFLHIAREADVPLLLGAIDFADKRVLISRRFLLSGDIAADMAAIKRYYRPFKGKHPEKFATE